MIRDARAARRCPARGRAGSCALEQIIRVHWCAGLTHILSPVFQHFFFIFPWIFDRELCTILGSLIYVKNEIFERGLTFAKNTSDVREVCKLQFTLQ